MITKFQIFEDWNMMDLVTSKNPLIVDYINKNSTFKDDDYFPPIIHISNGKDIRIKWNNNERHDMVYRIKRDTKLKKTSDFIKIVKKSLSKFVPLIGVGDYYKGEDYCLYMTSRKFYILISVYNNNIYDLSKPIINIRTILSHPSQYYWKIITINDENFLI